MSKTFYLLDDYIYDDYYDWYLRFFEKIDDVETEIFLSDEKVNDGNGKYYYTVTTDIESSLDGDLIVRVYSKDNYYMDKETYFEFSYSVTGKSFTFDEVDTDVYKEDLDGVGYYEIIFSSCDGYDTANYIRGFVPSRGVRKVVCLIQDTYINNITNIDILSDSGQLGYMENVDIPVLGVGNWYYFITDSKLKIKAHSGYSLTSECEVLAGLETKTWEGLNVIYSYDWVNVPLTDIDSREKETQQMTFDYLYTITDYHLPTLEFDDLGGLDYAYCPFKVYASAEEASEVYIPIDTTGLENCSLNIENYVMGTETTLTITTDANYIFSEAPTISYETLDDDFNATFTKISLNMYQLVLNETFNDVSGSLVVSATTEYNFSVESFEDKYGVLCGYKVDGSVMVNVSSQLKDYVIDPNEDGADVIEYDFTPYVVKLNRVYCNLITGDTKNIYLGTKNTRIKAPSLLSEYTELDLGTISVNGFYNNYLDILLSKIEIDLPYIGIEELEVSSVINKEINVTYKCNVIQNSCTAFIYVLDDDGKKTLIKTAKGTIGFELPYLVKQTSLENKSLNTDLMAIDPVVKVYYKKISNPNDVIFETLKTDVISNELGYFKVSKSNVSSTTATSTELEEIDNLLKQGCII